MQVSRLSPPRNCRGQHSRCILGTGEGHHYLQLRPEQRCSNVVERTWFSGWWKTPQRGYHKAQVLPLGRWEWKDAVSIRSMEEHDPVRQGSWVWSTVCSSSIFLQLRDPFGPQRSYLFYSGEQWTFDRPQQPNDHLEAFLSSHKPRRLRSHPEAVANPTNFQRLDLKLPRKYF